MFTDERPTTIFDWAKSGGAHKKKKNSSDSSERRMASSDSDDRLLGQNGLQHPEVVAAQNESDIAFLVAAAAEAVDQVGQVLDLLEVLDVGALVQRVVLVLERARAVVLDEVHPQPDVLV